MIIIVNSDYSEKVQYDNPDYPIFAKRLFLSSYPDYAAPSHWHDDTELIAVLSGKMRYNINGKTISLSKGEGVFVNSRQIHFGFSEGNTECEFLCVLFHPMLICANKAYEKEYVIPVTENQSLPFLHLKSDIPPHREILSTVSRIYKSGKEPAAPLKMLAAIMSLWELIYSVMPPMQESTVRSDGDLGIVKSMIGFIQQNYREKISLCDIACSGNVGQSKCCKLFSKYLGQTPNLYLTQYRLSKSIDLLKNTDMSITEIANETGFGGGSYYAEIFKRHFGKSPTRFRKLK